MNPLPSVKHYAFIMAALLALLVLTVSMAYVNFGALNTPVALLISTAKGALILLFFMNIRRDGPLAMLFATAGVFWLAILFTLSMSDFLTRH